MVRLLVLLAPLAASAQPPAGIPGYCLVERVMARGEGVAIGFGGNYAATRRRASGGEPRPVRIGPGRPPVLLRPGETMQIFFTHGSCTLNVAVNAGRLGLVARSFAFHLDDGPAETMQFFPAERRR